MMLGMAIRMATDLNLHRKSMASGLDTEEGRARDLEVGLTYPSLIGDPFSGRISHRPPSLLWGSSRDSIK